MKYSKKVCAYDKVIVALNADKDKYLNYETRNSGDVIENGCVPGHDSERSNFFGILKMFNIHDDGYVRVSFPKLLVLKENTNKTSS